MEVEMSKYNKAVGKKRWMVAFGLALSGLFVASVASVAWAQPGPHGHGGHGDLLGHHGHKGKEKRKAMHKRFKKMMSKVLRQDVGLDEKAARQVEKIHARQHVKRKALHKQMHQAKRALRTLIQADSNDQKAYSVAVDGLLKSRAALQRLRQQDFAKVRRLLTAKQQGKLLFAMHKRKRKMHRFMRKNGGHHKAHRRGRRGHSEGEEPGADG